MFKKGILTTFALLFGLIATVGQTAEFGTEAEAKSMIERAVNLVKEDKIRALDAFTDLEGGFGYKDLYVFCFNNKGIILAHPTNLGMDASELTDEDGVNIWSLVSSVKKGEIKKITYKLVRPTTESQETYTKTSFVTKVRNIYCGVGFYAE
ncbi:MAG TPA: chemotaxis protein [Betaproteobacteria bacterium]|jgi:cytochrome c|nr:chemotaxis protein [Betaproteobacteria bacterium]